MGVLLAGAPVRERRNARDPQLLPCRSSRRRSRHPSLPFGARRPPSIRDEQATQARPSSEETRPRQTDRYELARRRGVFTGSRATTHCCHTFQFSLHTTGWSLAAAFSVASRTKPLGGDRRRKADWSSVDANSHSCLSESPSRSMVGLWPLPLGAVRTKPLTPCAIEYRFDRRYRLTIHCCGSRPCIGHNQGLQPARWSQPTSSANPRSLATITHTPPIGGCPRKRIERSIGRLPSSVTSMIPGMPTFETRATRQILIASSKKTGPSWWL